jgi:hypothetical protein
MPSDKQSFGERRIRTGRSQFLLAGGVSLLTFLVYLFSLRNKFVLWDDNRYVYENPHIRSFGVGFLKWAFSSFYAANWHPLTWISHALDYAIWGLNPLGHHLTNSVFYGVNTFIVVLLVLKLMENYKGRTGFLDGGGRLLVAGTTGLLFGLHPIHVESVAWVAERKDLLCTLFFLLSIMAYINYAGAIVTESTENSVVSHVFSKKYLLAFGLFIFALLSKPMAVSLPFVLLILDWYPLERIQSLKSFKTALAEKAPFFA